jgi:DNA repair photolyase
MLKMKEEGKLYMTPISLVAGEDRYVCPLALVLNTYIGCQHECVYCYAKYIFEMYKHWDRRAPCDPQIVRDTISKSLAGKRNDNIGKLIQMRIPFRFSNLTDPFQQMEEKYRATYEVMKVLAEYNYPAVFNIKGVTGLTTPEYIELFKKFPCVFQYTIITDDDAMAKKLEPGAPSPTQRIEAMKILADNGFPCQLRYSPVFPGIYDNPESLFKKVSEVGCKDVICEQLHIPLNAKQKKLIDDALGFDYIEYLKKNGYPIHKETHWWKLEQDYKYQKLLEYKELAKKYNMGFTVCCEDRPQMNDYCNCCNTDKYGLNSLKYTIQMSSKDFEGKTVDEWIDSIEQKCPYEDKLREFFSNGKFCNCLTEHEFVNGTYRKKPKKSKVDEWIC